MLPRYPTIGTPSQARFPAAPYPNEHKRHYRTQFDRGSRWTRRGNLSMRTAAFCPDDALRWYAKVRSVLNLRPQRTMQLFRSYLKEDGPLGINRMTTDIIPESHD